MIIGQFFISTAHFRNGRLFLFGYREQISGCHDQQNDRIRFRHLTHPLSGERYRRRIAPALGRFDHIIYV